MLQAWDRDLPHTRNQCGVHRNFSRIHSTKNATYCAKVRLPKSLAALSRLHCLNSGVALHAEQRCLHLVSPPVFCAAVLLLHLRCRGKPVQGVGHR